MVGFSDWPPAAKAAAALLLLLLAAAVWSVLASAVFLAATGLLKGDTVPFAQWWTYWDHYGLFHPVAGFWLQLSGGVATALPLLAVAARLARGGGLPGTGGGPLHGATRWATRGELARAGFYSGFGGLYVARDARGRHLRYGGPGHVAAIAPTRSGKGVGLVVPNCQRYEASLVCLDVKRENWAASAGIRARCGQRVFLFDPLAPDGRTARYNPFSCVRRGTVDAFEDIQRIAQMVFPHAGGPEQFWTDAARSAFCGAAGLLAETPELPLTFGEVLRLLSAADGAKTMRGRVEARRQAGKPYTEATVQALEDYLKGSDDLVNSIRKTVTARLSLWFNPRIDAATSASDFDLRELRRSIHAIYVGVSPGDIAQLRPLLALFFQQLVDLTVRTLPQHDPLAKHQVLLLLDEFPLLGPMPVLADAFAYVAGYGVRIMLVMQSKAQLRDRDLYGPDKAAAILDNCDLEVVFGTKDLRLTEELSARLGYDTVEASSRSGPRFWRWLRRDRLNVTHTDQRRALLLPQEIARLGDRECILIKPGMYPIRARRIRFFEDGFFAKLVMAPPEVPPIEVNVRLDTGGSQKPTGDATPEAAPPPAAAPVPAPPVAPPPAAAEPPTPPAAGDAPKRPRRKPAAPGAAVAAGAQPAPARPGEAPPDAAATTPAPSPAPEADGEPTPTPRQSDGLLASIMGAEVDLSGMGLPDGKAAVAAIVAAVPTVSGRGRSSSRGVAAAAE